MVADDARTSALAEALWNPEIRSHNILRANEYDRYVRVQEVLEAARRSGYCDDAVESDLDALVEIHGGFRYEMVDPGQWIANLFRRLFLIPVPPRDDYYGLPEKPGSG